MSPFQELVWTFPIFLYAETHYRFKYFFSILRKAEPEVIADAPHRLEPGANIPLLILAKDADKYPATLHSVKVNLSQQGTILREIDLIQEPVSLNKPLWWNVYELCCDDIRGWLDVEVCIHLDVNGTTKTYFTDNHRTSSHEPLRIFLSDDPLPRETGMFFGDAHTHSDRTNDQVEFGVPIAAAKQLSQSIGLSYFCVADHSYDLDDAVDDFTRNDPSLPKWGSLLEEIRQHNPASQDFVVVQGEEVSCRNSKDQNVHLLLFGDDNFFAGSGDGAEQWLKTRSENSISEILEKKQDLAVAFAAHPMESVSLLQRALLGRGPWTNEDMFDKRLTGIQFANGAMNSGFQAGYRAWIDVLLTGQRLFCLAGNDAHGNFNRFRQIGIPFIRVRESDSQLFGKMRTGVFVQGQLDQNHILESLSNGRSIITDGPVANILMKGENTVSSLGSSYSGPSEFSVTASSSKEFGKIKGVKVFVGIIGDRAENVFLSDGAVDQLQYSRASTIQVTAPSYLRAEIFTSSNNLSDGSSHFCYTNPIWLTP